MHGLKNEFKLLEDCAKYVYSRRRMSQITEFDDFYQNCALQVIKYCDFQQILNKKYYLHKVCFSVADTMWKYYFKKEYPEMVWDDNLVSSLVDPAANDARHKTELKIFFESLLTLEENTLPLLGRQILELLVDMKTPFEIIEELKTTRTTFYKYMKRFQETFKGVKDDSFI